MWLHVITLTYALFSAPVCINEICEMEKFLVPNRVMEVIPLFWGMQTPSGYKVAASSYSVCHMLFEGYVTLTL